MQDLFESFRRKIKFGFYMEVMLNNGLGLKVMKYINPADIDMKDFGKMMDFYIRKMLEEHPEERLRVAQDIIDLVELYSSLSLD